MMMTEMTLKILVLSLKRDSKKSGRPEEENLALKIPMAMMIAR